MADKFQSSMLAANWDNALNGGLVAHNILGSAQSEQEALYNLGAGVRENKLRNSYFFGGGQNGNLPINQNPGVPDGWSSGGNGKVTINADSITFSNVTGQGDGYYFQKVDPKDLMLGKEHTASVLFSGGSDGKYAEFVCFVPDGIGYVLFSGSPVSGAGLSTITFTPPENTTGIEFRMCVGAYGIVGTLEAIAAKLEEGNKQTLARKDSSGTWQYIPQNNSRPSQVLAECQRYYQLYSSLEKRPSKAVDCRPVMRIDPSQGTIEIDGVTYYYNDASL